MVCCSNLCRDPTQGCFAVANIYSHLHSLRITIISNWKAQLCDYRIEQEFKSRLLFTVFPLSPLRTVNKSCSFPVLQVFFLYRALWIFSWLVVHIYGMNCLCTEPAVSFNQIHALAHTEKAYCSPWEKMYFLMQSVCYFIQGISRHHCSNYSVISIDWSFKSISTAITPKKGEEIATICFWPDFNWP